MNKYRFVALIFALILFSNLASAYFTSPYSYFNSPSSESLFSSGSNSHFEETPGFTQYPTAKSSKSSVANSLNTNFDTSSTAYDYRGPIYEKKSVYDENLLIDKSSKSGFFSSKANDILRHTITNTVTEKYIGASESLYIDNQNNRVSTSNSNSNENSNYDGGFSWGSARLYDQSEYQDAASYSDYGNYYYRPYYDSSAGYYNWNY